MILFFELSPVPAVPPHTVLTGDYFEVDHTAHEIKHRRGESIVATYGAAIWPGENLGEFPPYRPFAGVFRVVYAREIPMAGIATTLTDFQFNESTGAIDTTWSDGAGLSWPTISAMDDDLTPVDTDRLFLKRLILLDARRKNADISGMSAAIGTSGSIDGAAATPVQITRPE